MFPRLEINLSKISNNYSYLQTLTNSEVGCCIKSNAYGLGAREVARALAKVGCKELFVNNLTEALELKIALKNVNVRIYLFHGVTNKADAELIYKNNFIPVLNSMHQAQVYYSCFPETRKHVAIHVDTGMNRLAFSSEEYEKNIDWLIEKFEVVLLMSHLSCADEENNEYNKQQLHKFLKYKEDLKTKYGEKLNVKYSLANSPGLVLSKDYHFDLLRVGALLYNINYTYNKSSQLQNPIKLTAKILEVNNIKSGEYIGYSMHYMANTNSIIATINLGYSSGYPVCLSNKGKVYIQGHEANIVGRISMDLITLDVSNIDPNLLYRGQEVELINDALDINKLATLAGIFPYELPLRLNNSIITKHYIYD